MLLFEGGWAATKACLAWEKFLSDKLMENTDTFTSMALQTLAEIYLSCHHVALCHSNKETVFKTDDVSLPDLANTVALSADNIADDKTGNLLLEFFKTLSECKKLTKDDLVDVVVHYSDVQDGVNDSREKAVLHFQGFLLYVKKSVQSDKRLVWRAFHACGYDFRFRR